MSPGGTPDGFALEVAKDSPCPVGVEDEARSSLDASILGFWIPFFLDIYKSVTSMYLFS